MYFYLDYTPLYLHKQHILISTSRYHKCRIFHKPKRDAHIAPGVVDINWNHNLSDDVTSTASHLFTCFQVFSNFNNWTDPIINKEWDGTPTNYSVSLPQGPYTLLIGVYDCQKALAIGNSAFYVD